MSPPAKRACALALLVLLLLPAAAGQVQTPLDPAKKPDLIPSNPAASYTDERQPTRICTSVLNIGEGASITPFHVVLRVDDVDVGEKRVDGTFQTGHGTEPMCWELPLKAGPHVFRVTVDAYGTVSESREDNNVYGDRGFIVPATPKVDLKMMSLTVTPPVGKPDSTQSFIATIANIGAANATASEVDILDENGLIARLPIRPLRPGESVRVATVTSTNFRPVGEFVARAIVDPMGNLSEIDERNNEAMAAYEVLEHPAPDLAFGNVTLSGNLVAKRGLRLDAVVPNLGDRVANDVAVRLLNATNVSLGNATRASIGAGLNATLSFFFILPEGNHTLRLVVDPDAKVVERNETNNAHELLVVIEPPPPSDDAPNLVIDRLDAAPSDPRPGEPVHLTALVHNAGDNASAPHSVNFTVNGAPAGSVRVVTRLEPGRYASVTLTWPGGAEGIHAVRATVDAQREIKELDEGDNNRTLDLEVAVPPPPAPTPTPPPEAPVDETPAQPTPPANETPPEAGRVVIGELVLGTRAVPGGLKGIASASLRNPTLTPVGSISVTFKVDGRVLKEVLVSGLGAAATGSATTGEVDLPAGSHTLSAEVRILGASAAPVVAQRAYDAAAGEKGTPGFEGALLALAVAVVAMARRRTR